jgi:hypothetical protein
MTRRRYVSVQTIGPLTHDNMTGIRAPMGDRPSFWLHKLSRARKSGPFVSSALAFAPPSPLMMGDGNEFYEKATKTIIDVPGKFDVRLF